MPALSRCEPPHHDAAERLADRLARILARKHHVLADVHTLRPGLAAVAVDVGLLPRTDGRWIWWQVPDRSRSRPLWTYTACPATAARRLTAHVDELRSWPVAAVIARRVSAAEVLLDHVAPV